MKKQSFLGLVSNHLRDKYGSEMEAQILVFPNRRSILFFAEEWQGINSKPKWQPECVTIQELYSILNDLVIADEITLITELYKAIKKVDADILAGADGSFEKFYEWGRTLISDFDDIDKNMVDAIDLFRNMGDIEEQRNLDHLSPEQQDAIKAFFTTFSKEEQEKKLRSFVLLWRNLAKIYDTFRTSLQEKGIAYDGMAERIAIEKFLSGEKTLDETKTYHFIGFNLLHTTEERMFAKLEKAGRAKFYWDYDDFYVVNGKESKEEIELKRMREAGYFMTKNLYKNGRSEEGYKFKPELDASLRHNFESEKKIKFVVASSDNAQAKYLDKYCRELHADPDINDREVAVVLCDEGLLLPVLHSIADDITVNITMGFPLVQTPAFSLLKNLLDYHSQVSVRPRSVPIDYIARLLRSPYIVAVVPDAMRFLDRLKARKIFYADIEKELKDEPESVRELLRPAESATEMLDVCLAMLRRAAKEKPEPSTGQKTDWNALYTDLYQEALFRVHSIVVQFRRSIEEISLEFVSDNANLSGNGALIAFVAKLVCKAASSMKVPFSGEPVKGMQVMGFLETRGLDFSHVCMLSTGEKILPPEQGHNSFVPNSIRTAFGMTTAEQKVALYAYYFYRVLQRAEDITLIYNGTPTDNKGDGQRSRFMMQIQNETNHKIELERLDTRLETSKSEEIAVEKTDEIIEKLRRLYMIGCEDGMERALSPSALLLYLRCSLQFYFKYILSLKSEVEEEDEISAAVSGDVFHHCMEDVYKDIAVAKGIVEGEFCVQKEDLEPFRAENVYIALAEKWLNILYFNISEQEERIAHEEIKSRYTGRVKIAVSVVADYIRKQLDRDYSYAPFVYKSSEEDVRSVVSVCANGEEFKVYVGGRVDRQDEKDGQYRVVDYKTGGAEEKAEKVEELFNKQKIDGKKYVFQTVLYSSLLCMEHSRPILPVLSYVHKITKDNMDEPLGIKFGGRGTNKDDVWIVDKSKATEFMAQLSQLLSEIFSKDTPFTQTQIKNNTSCEYCGFKAVCKR